ncbi:reverse transcriptase-like protein [Sporolactobacillus sp. THM7-7]|nr:reverse transcriptase-like protein [Sporolactobacillus sp. THM7-7]
MIQVFFDGASGGPVSLSGGGMYINLGDGREERRAFPLGVMADNHEAEFAALVASLRHCLNHGYRSVSFHTDSQLVDQALVKRYVKKEIYARYLTEALDLIEQYDLFFCKWIPDRQNRNADRLARQAIRLQKKSTGKES